MRFMLPFSSLYIAFLLVWFVVSELFAEQIWWVTVLAYVPQHVWLVPPFGLLLWSAFKPDARVVALNLGSLGLVLFLFMGLKLNFPRVVSTDAIRVVSYNIRGASDTTRFLVEANADIVCLQESRDFAGLYDRLKIQLPNYQSLNSGELTLFSKFPILETKTFRVPKSNRVWTEHLLKVRGLPLRVINVHFLTLNIQGRNAKDSVSARVTRFSQYRWEITNAILKRVQISLEPVLLCGDFNTPPVGSLYHAFSSHLTDAFAARGFGFGFSYRSDLPVLRIDYLFTNLLVQNAFISDTRASDHRPMVADLRLL
jgi:endonuclease/exonuclease/phosphatase family metal-dependent hydrolase